MKKICLLNFLFVICIVYISCIGCAYKPLPDVLWKIRLETYTLDNCCSHKSAKYAHALNNVGIRANVMVGFVRGNPHAWVNVINPDDGTIHHIDPTGVSMRGIPWCKFREGVTGDEVFSYQGIIEIYLENIPIKHKQFFKFKIKEKL